jgi:hypothetical protein
MKRKMDSGNGFNQSKNGGKKIIHNRLLHLSVSISAAILLLLLFLVMVIGKYPSVGAEGAEILRGFVGDKAA